MKFFEETRCECSKHNSTKTCFKHKGQSPLNRQKFEVNSVMNSDGWIMTVNSDRWIVNFFLSSKHRESFETSDNVRT